MMSFCVKTCCWNNNRIKIVVLAGFIVLVIVQNTNFPSNILESQIYHIQESNYLWQKASFLYSRLILSFLYTTSVTIYCNIVQCTLCTLLFTEVMLTPRNRVFPRKLIVSQVVKNFSKFFLKTENSCRIYNRPPLAYILCQMNPVHTFLSDFFKVNFNIRLPPTPGSSMWSNSFRSSH
jgi:hypothetical protein